VRLKLNNVFIFILTPTLQQRHYTTENCEQKVRTFLTKVLKIEESRGKVRVNRVHRIGPYRANMTRPIVA